MQIDIQVSNLEQMRRVTEERGRRIKTEMSWVMEKTMKEVKESVPPYPPPLRRGRHVLSGGGTMETARIETRTYHRTGKLGKSIHTSVKSAGKDTVGIIGTNLSYSGYVIGPDTGDIGKRQAWMHKGRWWQLDKHIQSRISEIRTSIEKWIHEVIENPGVELPR